MSISTELWTRYGRLADGGVPEAVWRWAGHSLLDWTGVTLAGSREPLSRILREEYVDDGERIRPPRSAGSARIVGRDAWTDGRTAALLNSAAAHALDFDDSNKAGGGHHPSAPTVASALAVAQAEHASGAELLAAVIAGIEFSYRIGAVMGGALFTRGWHPTSALGVFGAVAAAASILRLDEERFGNAFGIAASLAAGVQANFGTMTKPLHAGLAAQSGITAARLGRRGLTSNPEALESMAGLAELMGEGTHADALAALDGRWVVTETIFKYHASCLGTHAPIEATRAALASAAVAVHAGGGGGSAVDDVERVLVRINPVSARICRFDYPRTGLEAKFSIRAATALTLLGDRTGDPGTFSDARVQDAAFLDMMSRIEVRTDPDVPRQNSFVALDTRRGERSEGHADSSIPSSDADAQQAKLVDKFVALASPDLGDRTGPLAERLLGARSIEDAATLEL